MKKTTEEGRREDIEKIFSEVLKGEVVTFAPKEIKALEIFSGKPDLKVSFSFIESVLSLIHI